MSAITPSYQETNGRNDQSGAQEKWLKRVTASVIRLINECTFHGNPSNCLGLIVIVGLKRL